MVVLALGVKGAGKTRLLRQLAWARLAAKPRCWVCVHDPGHQWACEKAFATVAEAERYRRAKGSLPRLTVIRADSAESVARWVYGPEYLEPEKMARPATAIFDELDQLCVGKTWKHGHDGYDLLHYGRHRQIDIWGAFRFTRNVPEDLPGLADFVFLLRHSSAALYDLRTLRARFGEAYTDVVTKLHDHECTVWRDGQ